MTETSSGFFFVLAQSITTEATKLLLPICPVSRSFGDYFPCQFLKPPALLLCWKDFVLWQFASLLIALTVALVSLNAQTPPFTNPPCRGNLAIKNIRTPPRRAASKANFIPMKSILSCQTNAPNVLVFTTNRSVRRYARWIAVCPTPKMWKRKSRCWQKLIFLIRLIQPDCVINQHSPFLPSALPW